MGLEPSRYRLNKSTGKIYRKGELAEETKPVTG